MMDGVITAPFDGFIARVDISESEIANANIPYITVVGGSDFEVILFVPEIDVGKIAVGGQVFVSLDAYPGGEEWLAEIYAIDIIDTLVDGVSVYKTYARLLNPDNRVRAGMNAKSRVVVAEKNDVLAIPLYFTRVSDEGFVVDVMRNGQLQEVFVTLGLRSSDGLVEITSGLNKGDTVVFSQ
jgi:RND family efflux transporter MFP subunit